MPREPAYADERSQDGEAKSASERAKGMDARSERPAMGHGSPEAGLGAERQDLAYFAAISASVMHFTLPALPAWPNCTMRSAQTFFIASREGFR